MVVGVGVGVGQGFEEIQPEQLEKLDVPKNKVIIPPNINWTS